MWSLIEAARAGLKRPDTVDYAAALLAHLRVGALPRDHMPNDAANATAADVCVHRACYNKTVDWLAGEATAGAARPGPKRLGDDLLGAVVAALEHQWTHGGERVARWSEAYKKLQGTLLIGPEHAGHQAARSTRLQVEHHLARGASGSTLRISGCGAVSGARHYVWDLATQGRAAAAVAAAQDQAVESAAATDVIAGFKQSELSIEAILHRAALEVRRQFETAPAPEKGFTTSAGISDPALLVAPIQLAISFHVVYFGPRACEVRGCRGEHGLAGVNLGPEC